MASKHVKRIRLLDNHLSLQYDAILFKVLGAMSKDSYTVIFTSVLVTIMRTSLFVNVRTSSLVNLCIR